MVCQLTSELCLIKPGVLVGYVPVPQVNVAMSSGPGKLPKDDERGMI